MDPSELALDEDDDDMPGEAKVGPSDSVAAARLLLLTQKYFYAGGSARWMFRFDTALTKSSPTYTVSWQPA